MAFPPCTIFHNPDLKWNIVQQCTITCPTFPLLDDIWDNSNHIFPETISSDDVNKHDKDIQKIIPKFSLKTRHPKFFTKWFTPKMFLTYFIPTCFSLRTNSEQNKFCKPFSSPGHWKKARCLYVNHSPYGHCFWGPNNHHYHVLPNSSTMYNNNTNSLPCLSNNNCIFNLLPKSRQVPRLTWEVRRDNEPLKKWGFHFERL